MIDDSENDVLLIIRELKKGGYNPVYERVETAIAMQKALKEKQWDIILCDYKMPNFNAFSTIAILKKANINAPLNFLYRELLVKKQILSICVWASSITS